MVIPPVPDPNLAPDPAPAPTGNVSVYYEYVETPPPITRALLITGFTVIRADSPGLEEVVLNIADGTVTDGKPQYGAKRSVTLGAGSLKSLSAVMTELYDAVVAEKGLPAGVLK